MSLLASAHGAEIACGDKETATSPARGCCSGMTLISAGCHSEFPLKVMGRVAADLLG